MGPRCQFGHAHKTTKHCILNGSAALRALLECKRLALTRCCRAADEDPLLESLCALSQAAGSARGMQQCDEQELCRRHQKNCRQRQRHQRQRLLKAAVSEVMAMATAMAVVAVLAVPPDDAAYAAAPRPGCWLLLLLLQRSAPAARCSQRSCGLC